MWYWSWIMPVVVKVLPESEFIASTKPKTITQSMKILNEKQMRKSLFHKII